VLRELRRITPNPTPYAHSRRINVSPDTGAFIIRVNLKGYLKMDIYKKIAIVSVGIVFSLDVMEVNPVQAATFSFSLDDQNVALGGLLSGTFKASDNNSDGLIT
jgi:hypothetical protein